MWDFPVSGERIEFGQSGSAGRVRAFVAGRGAPLLLVYRLNAAASAAEVRPLHEHYAASRRAYCIDLPDLGYSERSDRIYTPRLMTDAVLALLAEVLSREGGVSVDALAVSTSCEFLARAAQERPTDSRSVALGSPTGLRQAAATRPARRLSSFVERVSW